MRALVLITLVATGAWADNFYRLASPYTHTCNENSLCVQQLRTESKEFRSLENCQLTCGNYGSLWPSPTGDLQLSKETVYFTPQNMKFVQLTAPNPKVTEMLEDNARYFERNIHFLHPDFEDSKKTPYTEEEKIEIFKDNQFDQSSRPQQRNPPINQNIQDQTRPETERIQRERFENWQRFSPFYNQRNSRRTETQNVNIHVTVASPDTKLTLKTDESYTLEVKTVGDETTVKIQAPTYYGARHALESLSQLIAFDDNKESLMIVNDATIKDKPEFKFRGLMLDTSRNFYPKEELLRLFDAMSQNKMNYFQWHINDAAAFPMYLESIPKMAYYGAYSSRQVYYPDDIREIVQYANLRGIDVIPVIGGPGHARAGWEWGEKSGKGKLILCADQQKPWFELGSEPPVGQMNPINPELYNVLGDIYRDTLEYFDPKMMNMGGDDVSFKCWQNSEEIKKYFTDNAKEVNSRELFELWNVYQKTAFNKLQEVAGTHREITPIISSSSFARNYIDKEKYIIQLNEFANESIIADYVNNGFKVIFSNFDQWRLDCAGTSWIGGKSQECPDETPTWEHFYRNSPLDMLTYLGVANARSTLPNKENVLGGLVSMYSSETDANGFQSKAWPRVSGMAERMWSDPVRPLQGIDLTQIRLNRQRQRMVFRGVRADPLQPEYCMRDESACYSREQYSARTANIPQ